MGRQDRPEILCLRLCDRTVVILPKQGGIGMAEVLRGQAGVVVLGKVVGSVAVTQTIVRPISSDDLQVMSPNDFYS